MEDDGLRCLFEIEICIPLFNLSCSFPLLTAVFNPFHLQYVKVPSCPTRSVKILSWHDH